MSYLEYGVEIEMERSMCTYILFREQNESSVDSTELVGPICVI